MVSRGANDASVNGSPEDIIAGQSNEAGPQYLTYDPDTKEQLWDEGTPHVHLTDASRCSVTKDVAGVEDRWTPIPLRARFWVPLVVFMILLAVGLEIALHFSNVHQGILLFPNIYFNLIVEGCRLVNQRRLYIAIGFHALCLRAFCLSLIPLNLALSCNRHSLLSL